MDVIEQVFNKFIDEFSTYILIAGLVGGGLVGFSFLTDEEIRSKRGLFGAKFPIIFIFTSFILMGVLVIAIFRFGEVYPLSTAEKYLFWAFWIVFVYVSKKLRYWYWKNWY